MNRYMLALGWALLITAVCIGTVAANTFTAPKTWVAGDPIRSSDFNALTTALAASINGIDSTQINDSAVAVEHMADSSVGQRAIMRNAIEYRHINYTDSSQWDTLPVAMTGGAYTGDSTAARRIDARMKPMHVELTTYSVTGCAQFVSDVRWDTTQAMVTYGGVTRFIGSTLTITKGDTEFVVTTNGASDTNANQTGVRYLWTAWGEPRN